MSKRVDQADAGRETVVTRRRRAIARRIPERSELGQEVDRDAIMNEIEIFAKTIKAKDDFNVRELIEDGQK